MRKFVILTGILVVISVTGLAFTHSWLNPQKEDVIVAETVLAGDRTKAKGIELSVEVQSTENMLYWQVKTQLGDTLTSTTDFALNDSETILREGDLPQEFPLQLGLHFPYGGTGTSVGIDVNEELGQTMVNEMIHNYHIPPQMILDAAEKTPNGEEKTYKLPLADYLEVMPLTLDYQEFGINSDYNLNGDYLDYDYFQIPVPENFCYEVDIEKNIQGRVTFYGASPSGDADYQVNSSGLVNGNMLYMAVSGISKGGDHTNQPFADILPEQRGIHCIPLVEKTGMLYMDFDHASIGFQLSEDEVVLQMHLSENKEDFLLFTEEKQKIYLSLIDKETMIRTQKLALIDAKKHYVTAKVGDGYAVVLMESGDFVWLTEKESQFKIHCSDTITAQPEMKNYVPNTWDENFSISSDGRRLAIAAVGLGYNNLRSSDCVLQVFDKNGLTYVGLYKNSLQSDMLNHDMDESWLKRPVYVRFVN